LVLEIAAIFGRDPSDPQRAVELLTLLNAYQDGNRAAAAVESLSGGLREVPRMPFGPRLAVWRVARLAAGRFWPGAGLLIDGLTASNATDDLGRRAIRFYQDRKAG
jgi:hypothetical protein